jgi:hypothetical protein
MHATDDRVILEVDFLVGNRGTQVRESAQQYRQRELQFRAGQVLADALMGTVAECHVLAHFRPVNVEAVGIVEYTRIAIPGIVRDNEPSPAQ